VIFNAKTIMKKIETVLLCPRLPLANADFFPLVHPYPSVLRTNKGFRLPTADASAPSFAFLNSFR
jgi:hypothetical protein